MKIVSRLKQLKRIWVRQKTEILYGEVRRTPTDIRIENTLREVYRALRYKRQLKIF